MFKIEFDETNPLAVNAASIALQTLSGYVEKTITTKVTDNSVDTMITNNVKEAARAATVAAMGNTVTDSVPPPALNDTDSELDSEGLPWDSRIHAKTKTKNADLTWKILRRPKTFDTTEDWESFISSVKAELKLAAPATTDDSVPPPNDFGTTTTDDNVPPPNEFGATTEETPAPAEEENITFPVLMKFVTGSKGAITQDMFQEICDGYEIAKPADLSKAENRIFLPAIYEELKELVNE